MKVVMLSKALVSRAYQKKLEELARLPGVDLLAIVPPFWHEPGVGPIHLEYECEQGQPEGYRLEVLPMLLNGQHHLHFYPGLRRLILREKPDVFHIDEEAFNLATYLAMRAGVEAQARCCFFNWANMDRRYPPPFCWFEQYAFRQAAHAIVGNQEAARIIERHGYRGPITLLPQFGVDPDLFSPRRTASHAQPPNLFVIGYMGRLVEAKGVLDLVEVLTHLPDTVHLQLVGNGDLRPRIEQRAQELAISHRIELCSAVPSTQVPDMLRRFDVLALPSQTTPNWKEQFGRILVEAMSCSIPVVGSSSGEIANVIGDAGLVYPEQNISALRHALLLLYHQPALRQELGQRGRERVLKHYTQAALARSYYAVYEQMCENA